MRWTLRNEVRAPGGLEVDAGSSAELIARVVDGTQRPNPEDARRLPGRSEGKLFERRNELIFRRAFPRAEACRERAGRVIRDRRDAPALDDKVKDIVRSAAVVGDDMDEPCALDALGFRRRGCAGRRQHSCQRATAKRVSGRDVAPISRA